MIIALKTRKLLIKIAIGKARAGGEVGLGEFLRSMEFFWFYLHAFFSRVFPLALILQPLPVARKFFFFLRGIYIDRLFFPFPVLR